MSWHFTEEKVDRIAQDVLAATIRESVPFSGARYIVADLPREQASLPDYDDRFWQLLPESRAWGSQEESTAWLRVAFTAPADWTRGRVVAHVRNLDCESIAYVDGKAISALDGRHYDANVSDHVTPGRTYLLALEAYSGLSQTARYNPYFESEISDQHRLAEAEFRLIDPDILDYSYDLRFALDATKTLDRNSREYNVAIAALDASVDMLDFRKGAKDDAFLQSVHAAQKYLKRELYDKYQAGDLAPVMWSTGHAHIDTAWLWRLAHTRKKCERTFTTQVDLIERYPDYIFSCSQPQQYEYVKEDNPELYSRIKQAARKGNWVPLGGMWIEPDCNVVSGESLVRQFLYGMRFTEQELGYRSKVLWLPDVFGYSAALPQIMQKCGVKYFMTIKIFWNQINKPPYHTFQWEGIDGTKVLSHFSPFGNYNGDPQAVNLKRGWDNYAQKNVSNSDLWIFGMGDGGGGPTADQIEYSARAKNFIGMPKLKSASPEEFFEDLEAQVVGNRELPVWRGELYLELHRGTYTSQSNNKRYNRECEFMLQTIEQIASLAQLFAGGDYPSESLLRAWKMLLLNQFHDILPGSSITEVYRDSDIDYAKIKNLGEEMLDTALATIASKIEGHAGETLAYNPLSWPREDVAEAPTALGLIGQKATSIDGEAVTVVDLRGKLPSLGYSILSSNTTLADSDLRATESTLENQFYRIKLDKNGEIESLFDKRVSREVIDSTSYCRGNALLSFEDKPALHEAWDVDIFYNDKLYPIQNLTSIEVIENGPIRAGIEITRTVDQGRGSVIKQRIYIYRDLPRIDFVTRVDWKERQTLLKVAFPVTINALQATYDIQFGNLERTTHWNTSWDWARFEVCAHKWADLSEGNYGVSLLSDCKYGWDIRDNVMRLTLIKSGISPDPVADLGSHSFTYSLYPHQGTWRAAETVRRAYELNVPAKLIQLPATTTEGAPLPHSMSLVTVDQPNLIIETVKKAEDDNSIIVRISEQYNQRGTARLTFPTTIQSASSVNLLEDEPDGDDPVMDGSTLSFSYKPYEIRSFKVKLAS